MTDYFGAMGTALYNTLTGGTVPTGLITELGGTAIFANQAPNGQALPYCIYSNFSGGPENNPSGMRDNLWFVRGYASKTAKANAIDGQIDALLSDKQITVSGFSNFWLTRDRDLTLVETPKDGELIFMAGALYRVRLGY